MSSFLLESAFADPMYSWALDAIAYLSTLGTALSDGHVVFQPRKIPRSDIWNGVRGRY